MAMGKCTQYLPKQTLGLGIFPVFGHYCDYLDYGSTDYDKVFLVAAGYDFHRPADSYFHFDACNHEKIRIGISGKINKDSLISLQVRETPGGINPQIYLHGRYPLENKGHPIKPVCG